MIYQIYPRSFADSDGDGIGDLPGIRSRLPYLRELGVDAVWISPFYPSPMADAGYDVSDYRDIEPIFGTLADADALLADAHELGIRVIIDLVPNHTSDEHEWFRAALAAAPGSPERARYLFREGRGEHGEIPPNDWISNFGGGVDPGRGSETGERVHPRSARGGRPAPDQPVVPAPVRPEAARPRLDQPGGVAEFESILRFWLDRGIDGFRIDVAHGLAKDPEMPDLEGNWAIGGPAVEGHPHWDRDEVHDVYRGWRRVTDSYDGDRVFVGEVWVQTPEQLARYLRSDELHTAFNFTYLLASWDAKSLHKAIDDSIDALSAVGAPATWVLSNHDVVRHVTRYGGGRNRHPPRTGGDAADARPTRRGLRLPGRGAGPGRGDRPAPRGAPGPGLRALRSRPRARGRRRRPARRMPGTDPVVGRRAPVRFRARLRPALAAPACRLGGADRRTPAGRPGVDARALPSRPGAAPRPAGAGRRHDGVDRHRRRRCSRSAATRASCAWSTWAASPRRRRTRCATGRCCSRATRSCPTAACPARRRPGTPSSDPRLIRSARGTWRR